MKYLGSKDRIAKRILPIMLEEADRKGIETWVELFVGGGNMIDKVPKRFKRIGCDFNPHTISALTAVRDFPHELPDSLSEEQYKPLKGLPAEPVSSWLRFVGSYGGRFGEGFARGSGRNYVAEAKRNAIKQSDALKGVQLITASYDELYFENCLIYLDAPYKGVKGYSTGRFDHDKYWRRVLELSSANSVFISEYEAPEDFLCVYEENLKTSLSANGVKESTEKLFTLNPFLLNGR